MRKKYKNEIFQILITHPLGINNFEVEEDDLDVLISYIPFDRRFTYRFIQSIHSFDYFGGGGVGFSPSFEWEYRVGHGESTDFFTVLQDFQRWLDYDIQNYVDDEKEPDLFEEYKKGVNLSNVTNIDYSNISDFNYEEKAQIKISLLELKAVILEKFVSSDEQGTLVLERLTYLEESLDRLNKTDWKGILISTFFAILITLSLDTERGKELYDLFLLVFHIRPLLGV